MNPVFFYMLVLIYQKLGCVKMYTLSIVHQFESTGFTIISSIIVLYIVKREKKPCLS